MRTSFIIFAFLFLAVTTISAQTCPPGESFKMDISSADGTFMCMCTCADNGTQSKCVITRNNEEVQTFDCPSTMCYPEKTVS